MRLNNKDGKYNEVLDYINKNPNVKLSDIMKFLNKNNNNG